MTVCRLFRKIALQIFVKENFLVRGSLFIGADGSAWETGRSVLDREDTALEAEWKELVSLSALIVP